MSDLFVFGFRLYRQNCKSERLKLTLQVSMYQSITQKLKQQVSIGISHLAPNS